MQNPQVTIVVVPRERFSCTQASLESIYQHTDIPFKLVYVDGNSPKKVRSYLEKQAKEKDFQLLRTNYYLPPNHARNLGLNHVDTKYLVFIDNDVIVSQDWLSEMLTCAEETGAMVVTPLVCEREPVHEIVHCAGGENRIVTDVHGKKHLREKMYKQMKKVADVRPQMQRTPTELAEFHCMLVRTDIFERVGHLDEKMLCTKEHLDFCMMVAQAGGSIYFEPASIVTYVPGPPLEITDVHFYMLRWSNAWTLNSLEHLRQKWNLTEDGYFKTKYKKLGWRRRSTIVKPLSRRLSFGLENKYLNKVLRVAERKLNRYLTDQYDRSQARKTQASPTLNYPEPSMERL